MTWVAAALVVTTLAAMASGRVDPIVALLAALVLGAVLDLAPPAELAAGLSNAGVITVAGMLVIAKGIVQTGVVARATWALLSSAASARQAFRRLAGPIGIASALINTTPLVALLIPATRQLEQTKRIPARELLLPMAHVTTLVGSVTLIGTSSNLVIAGIASQRGVEMSMLSFAPVALPVALVGTRDDLPDRPADPPRHAGDGHQGEGVAGRDPGDRARGRREPPRGQARDLPDAGVRAGRRSSAGAS